MHALTTTFTPRAHKAGRLVVPWSSIRGQPRWHVSASRLLHPLAFCLSATPPLSAFAVPLPRLAPHPRLPLVLSRNTAAVAISIATMLALVCTLFILAFQALFVAAAAPTAYGCQMTVHHPKTIAKYNTDPRDTVPFSWVSSIISLQLLHSLTSVTFAQCAGLVIRSGKLLRTRSAHDHERQPLDLLRVGHQMRRCQLLHRQHGHLDHPDHRYDDDFHCHNPHVLQHPAKLAVDYGHLQLGLQDCQPEHVSFARAPKQGYRA